MPYALGVSMSTFPTLRLLFFKLASGSSGLPSTDCFPAYNFCANPTNAVCELSAFFISTAPTCISLFSNVCKKSTPYLPELFQPFPNPSPIVFLNGALLLILPRTLNLLFDRFSAHPLLFVAATRYI